MMAVDHVGAHRVERLRDVVGLEQLVALLVDHLALVVGDVVVLEQVLAHVEVARLDLALRVLDRARDPRMLDRLAVGHLQPLHDRGHAVGREDAQQRILERQVEAARARVALASRAAAQLVVDAARLVALGADDVQPPGGDHLVVQLLPVEAHLLDRASSRAVASSVSSAMHPVDLGLGIAAEHDVGAAARHVGGDGDHLRPAGLHHDLRLARVLLRVQHVVRQLLLLEHPGEQLGVLDRGRADQHRLAALVAVLDVVDDRLVLLARGADRPGPCGLRGSSSWCVGMTTVSSP